MGDTIWTAADAAEDLERKGERQIPGVVTEGVGGMGGNVTPVPESGGVYMHFCSSSSTTTLSRATVFEPWFPRWPLKVILRQEQ